LENGGAQKQDQTNKLGKTQLSEAVHSDGYSNRLQ
jgi:hypothetical protein